MAGHPMTSGPWLHEYYNEGYRNTDRVTWYPHRERLESINPNGIAPWDWGPQRFWQNTVYIPIWAGFPVAWYI